MKFPKTVYVRSEKEGAEEEFLVVDKNISGENGDSVAIYQLVEIKQLQITEKLV